MDIRLEQMYLQQLFAKNEELIRLANENKKLTEALEIADRENERLLAVNVAK